ncbi:MAG: ABC transporter permease [Streptosporangiaceae bacterium]|nr:ABC transporter permease [Streptosporangiaceae bacterium]MBV9854083.1 ABC transporter permease [Streptosporangiaceae bacterium]
MAIAGFLIRRILTGIVVVWLVSTGAFFLFFARPVATVARQLAGHAATPQVIAEVIRNLGLDQPIMVQYWHFLDNLVHGNLGYSYFTQEPVNTMLKQDLPPTISVVVGGVIIWLVVGIGVGIISATRPRSWFDRVSNILVLVGLSMPVFVIGELLILVVFLPLNRHGITWINTGYAGISQGIGVWMGHMILPWITLAAVYAAVYTRLTRGQLLDTLGEDYIRTARAKGLSERRVTFRHGVRAALTPVVSQLGVDVGQLLGGVVVVESVFGLGGLGQTSVQAIYTDNLPVIIGFVIVAAAFVVIANIIVDLTYALLDPRVRIT